MRFRLIPSSSGDVEIGSYTQVPGSARAEAERRRYASDVNRGRILKLNFIQGNGIESPRPATRPYVITFGFTIDEHCAIPSSSATSAGGDGLYRLFVKRTEEEFERGRLWGFKRDGEPAMIDCVSVQSLRVPTQTCRLSTLIFT